MGSFDYGTVTRLQGVIGGENVDRLLFTTNAGYPACTAPTGCCGGTPHPTDPNLCNPPADPATSVDSALGPVAITGDPYRPWDWTRRTDNSLDFALIEQDANTSVGPGPNCRTRVPYTHLLGGYAPAIVDRFTRPTAGADGFHVYLNTSVGRDEGYNVDTARFTVAEATD